MLPLVQHAAGTLQRAAGGENFGQKDSKIRISASFLSLLLAQSAQSLVSVSELATRHEGDVEQITQQDENCAMTSSNRHPSDVMYTFSMVQHGLDHSDSWSPTRNIAVRRVGEADMRHDERRAGVGNNEWWLHV